ncbi:MAG: 3-deoxy-7-phosphoheptulonate synthase [Spirochaetales bacterium]|uniref:3-deoxy-7-phosphoheptulonate synthase n=1 Tax=Candidatus Thalassospirochaeta sargassi TaxID=3119039 RepID=A0AAJ1IJI6_9SPIO|nr:3-deoxy-7-phosphoheptulonate synthase [Spirochaetales bacterium]
MIIILNRDIKAEHKLNITNWLEDKGFKVKEIVGEEETVLGAVGAVAVDPRSVELLEGVKSVIPISKPYKLASRELKKEDTVITVGNVKIGGPRVAVVAGPCAVESKEQIMAAAEAVYNAGAVILRGGAFKPRTSPYAFQGHGEKGLKWLKAAGEKYDMPVATEIVSPSHIDIMREYVDIYQIGARNMQNFELLKAVGELGKPVILKRGLSAKIEEWLMAAEYLLAHGTDNVILCERGIRTFESYTRNTLDISAIPIIKKLSHLPIITDPSHGTGLRGKVHPMALAAVAAGTDGLMIEVHPKPEEALSDGPQSLYPEQFDKLMKDIEALSPVISKEIERPLRQGFAVHRLSTENMTRADKTEGKLRVAYQGEPGAYSENAAGRHFGEQPLEFVPSKSFEAVFDSVLTGSSDYGVIPVENALTGSIHECFDLFLRYPDINIVGEKQIRIRHNLIALPGADISKIKKVYSHPQGLMQCERFLDGLDVERIPYYDTAGSCSLVAQKNSSEIAAIAGVHAASYYGLEILKEGIETNPSNFTRFFIIARCEHPEPEQVDKATVVFSVPDKKGSLVSVLQVMNENGLNMKKLESRPIHGKPWEYMFYSDIELPARDDFLSEGINQLKKVCEDFRLLGIYKAGI